ncbi:MAG: protease inhibitor I42 family protein [Alphaproteobacteria bacterium]|nr:protease inhibitor I42 family protein [Alphaproteobacteria bacterium]
MMAGAASLGLLLAAEGCTKPAEDPVPVAETAVENDPVSNAPESRSLPAPPADGVVRDVTEADAGGLIDLKVGDTFSVSLSGVPTAGYVWAPQTLPSIVEKTAETGGPTSSDQLQPGFAGGNHWEVTVFKAVSTGEAELVMAQRRPWEDAAEPDAATFRVRLRIS